MNDARALNRRDHLVGAALSIGYLLLLLGTASDLAMSRDESFYVHAAKNAADWISQIFVDPSNALAQQSIDRAWRYNWEHPAWMKLSFAWSWLAQKHLGLFPNESLAFRFPGMLSGALLLWLIYAWGASVMRREGALFAALAFASMPRVFYHSHLACFDIPIAFFVTLTAYAYWRSLADRRWLPCLGLSFGLALATKHNSWILPGIFLIHFLWIRSGQVRSGRSERASIAWLPAMLILGPLVLIGTWPWLWHDTGRRLLAYASFHLRHVHYTYEFLGISYFEPPLPISVPVVMTLFTVSLTVLALCLVGLYTRRAELRIPWLTEPRASDGRRTEVLWVGCLLAPLLVIALPSSPIFGGTKHWITAYPFLALFAGVGLVALIERAEISSWLGRRWPTWAFAALCLLPGAVETAQSHPFGLSHYTPIAGGVPGAADLGMNRQFWGFTTGSLIDWIAAKLPDGGSVWTCDTTHGSWAMMQRDGLIPSNIRAEASMSAADLVLVHHEAHFVEVDYQAWVAFESAKPVYVLRYAGVPIISVYENPARAVP
ncbi:MAG: glycosyltransferase family 39 protein [Deltaproteobacteria bacterium]|nr:glycosyltransferase family 39 protein [Deltaproteobacteria bacterium]NND28242.1 phospholipid carrier-dependent glycosyltransferase [Myxococcales bacterium]MBT8466264.1 glycosyltransferase family 39 protein [Deltaproteobacteria bacterium]MBT8482815.1 glycosyltransferase family 39 protein [Deltaproteobacteria bacterium]NNK42381.1 phospholipid carrier-dependent glycosyltransferase [Myxococcales bacterium]